jgi:hypothetical protein
MPAHPGLRQIAFPLHLTPQQANGALGMGLGQQAQAGFDGGFLRTRSATPHGLGHQAIVNVNVRPHLLLPMCINITFMCIAQ